MARKTKKFQLSEKCVPLKQAEKLLKGHSKYLRALRDEYAGRVGYGSINDCIREAWDDKLPKKRSQEEFDEYVRMFTLESECTETRFVFLAMLGYEPDE